MNIIGIILTGIFGIVLALGSTVFGLFVVLGGSLEFWTQFQSRKWPPTSAWVNGIKIESHTSEKSSTKYYSYIITYTYLINRQEYTSTGFEKGGFSTYEKAETEARSLYSDKRRVTVFYNPKQHDESASLSGSNESHWWIFLGYLTAGMLTFCVGFNGGTSITLGELGFSKVAIDRIIAPVTQGLFPLSVVFVFIFVASGFFFGLVVSPNKKGSNTSLLLRLLQGSFGMILSSFIVFNAGGPFLQSLGFFLIGPKPDLACYNPDLKQKKWIVTPCPPSSQS